MELSQLLGDKVAADLDFPGGTVSVVYRPSVYTREFEASLDRVVNIAMRSERGEQISEAEVEAVGGRDYYVQALCDFLVSWSLTEQGVPIPLTTEAIDAKLPTAVLFAFVWKLVQAVQGEAGRGRREQETAQPTPMNRAERRANVRRVK